MAMMLGLDIKQAKETVSAIPESIIKQIKERSSEKWIMPGVKEL
jgi:RNase P/RNase MRP subunit p30